MDSPEPGTGGPSVILDGRYRLEQRLGEGAMGVVYRALHLGLKKPFAVKLLKADSLDSLALARFRREAEALGQLRHPSIVEVSDFGIDAAAGVPYLVMELLEGITLAEICREQGPLPLERALPLLTAIAAAVDAAHLQGILHRDLKPGNILLGRTPGGEPSVKVLDFGLAELTGEAHLPGGGEEAAGERLTATGSLLGTPLYTAPEVIRHGVASRASDLYSFGVIAYELLAGHPPFQGSTAQVLAGHLEREAPPLREEVWQPLQELLGKDPALRPRTALAVVERLRQAAEREALARWRAAELPRRTRLAAGLSAALLLAALLLPGSVVPAAERWLHDLRVRTAPARPPDPRILLLTIDEASLAEGGSLADRADELGATLARVLAAGARGVAVDLLLPRKWSDSPAFSELVVRYPRALTLAVFSGPDGSGRVTGAECIGGLTAAALGPERASGLFGFVNLVEDPDGVTRRGRLRYRDRSGGFRPSWAAKAAAALPDPLSDPARDPFWIDARIDWPRYQRISWRELPAVLDRSPGVFRERLVLVGGDFRGSGDDYHRIPHRSPRTSAVSGLTLQALLVDTIAAGLPVREPARAPVLIIASLLAGVALTWTLQARRAGRAALSLAAVAALYVAVSFPAFWWMGLMLPVSSPLLLALSGLILALAVRRRLPPAPEVSS